MGDDPLDYLEVIGRECPKEEGYVTEVAMDRMIVPRGMEA
jgi:hypothetical protein